MALLTSGQNRGVKLQWQLDYPAEFEVIALDRIDRSGGKQAYSYPGGRQVPIDQELADAPILEIRPASGAPWVGVFYGAGYRFPSAAPGRLIGWPDGRSLCVCWAGGADVVRSDDASQTYEIEAVNPITGLLSIPELELVVFADFTTCAAYGPNGHRWTSPRVATDDLRLLHAENGVIEAVGFVAGTDGEAIRVDAATGQPLS